MTKFPATQTAANGDGRRLEYVVSDSALEVGDSVASVAQETAEDVVEARTPPRMPLLERLRKRGRVESESYDHSPQQRSHAATVLSASRGAVGYGSPLRGLPAGGRRRVLLLVRSLSLPNVHEETDDPAIHNIFPDVNPMDLRIAEVKSWDCPWMHRSFPVDAETSRPEPTTNGSATHKSPQKQQRANGQQHDARDELEAVIATISSEFSMEEKALTPAHSTAMMSPQPLSTPSSTASSTRLAKRPTLRLKLEDMPTPQQAEDRAQRAASRIIARREAMERAMVDGQDTGEGASASQKAIMRLNFKSYSSGDESDVQSPNGTGRLSGSSAYSPNQGMFTTKSVAVSEAGISSPDSGYMHLQEHLERVREIGRGASGVVYKAVHVPTLKVVAIKDVPVYGRGQRRQMVRELHALYSNLVPISDNDKRAQSETRRTSAAKAQASPYIVSFYDAFVDRAKNCICLVMEYMSAGSLQDIVLRGGCQNEKVLSRLAHGVLRGLAHIHSKNMVHRDIKPHNLLTNRHGEVKISDFGLAKTLNDNSSTTKTFVGTLLYMAPERIGGGDYSYAADVWSFGLALISVALGKYPLPTQDGFFGLVDSVANEQYLELPKDKFSSNCRHFIHMCLKTDPEERPPAQELLRHPFITMYTEDETLEAWNQFVDSTHLCEDREAELTSLGEAVYRHIYERSVKFSYQPQSDYGVSFASPAAPFARKEVSIQPVQMSLQLGLANYLGLPVHLVYELFEEKRNHYSDKLLEEYCYSPQSWSASPGIGRRQQWFGSDTESPMARTRERTGSSFWRKLHDGLSKFKNKRRQSKAEKGSSRHLGPQ